MSWRSPKCPDTKSCPDTRHDDQENAEDDDHAYQIETQQRADTGS